jgi:hypothetical protein
MTVKPKSLSPLDMPADVYRAYKKDFQNGIVTVGDVCNADCFFCSQKGNPPGVIKTLKRFLTMGEVKHFAAFLGRTKWLASAIHTNSGEFFSHPDAAKVLDYLIAENKLSAGAQIFSNGMGLTAEHIKMVKKAGLGLWLSLNSADIDVRKGMMGGSYLNNKMAIASVELLNRSGIDYQVWIVPSRSNLDNGNLEYTCKYLRKFNPPIVISRPGSTKLTPPQIAKELAISNEELWELVSVINQKYKLRCSFSGPGSPEESYQAVTRLLRELFDSPKHLAGKRKLFLCAESVRDILPKAAKELGIEKYDIQPVKAKVFGGNIECAGLLLVEDYICAIEEYLERSKKPKPEVLILPRVSFDVNMEDLAMTPVKRIKDRFKIEVVTAGSPAA